MDGLDLTTIGTLGTAAGGTGVLGFAVVALIRVLPGVLAKLGAAIAGAITRVSEAVARAREKREESAHVREQRRLREAETEAMEAATNAGVLDEMRAAIARAEERATQAEREARALRQWCIHAAYVMQTRGITPPDFPAAMLADGGE